MKQYRTYVVYLRQQGVGTVLDYGVYTLDFLPITPIGIERLRTTILEEKGCDEAVIINIIPLKSDPRNEADDPEDK